LWLVSRVILALLTYYAALFQASLTSKNPVLTPDLLLGKWLQWDATYYVNIAHYGYGYQAWTAFFPLYPLLIHLLTAVIGSGHEVLAGMIISNLATLAAFIGLGFLVAQESGTSRAISRTLLVLPHEEVERLIKRSTSRTISHTILALAAYPFAFFLAAPYTEGLFLACAVWALLAARRGWWYLAFACTLIGGLTRPTGVILVLPLVYEFGRQHGWWQQIIAGVRQRDWSVLRQLPGKWSWRQASLLFGIVAAVPLALGIFALICMCYFGDPLLFLKIHDQWNRLSLPIWTALWRGFVWQGAIIFLHHGVWSYENARSLVDFVPVLLIGGITLASIRRMPVSFTLYMLGLLYISIDPPVRIGASTVEYDSAGRYLLLSVPIFLLLGRWITRFAWLEMLVVGGGFVLQAIFAAYYLTGGWLI
jgi:hypothetical protein